MIPEAATWEPGRRRPVDLSGRRGLHGFCVLDASPRSRLKDGTAAHQFEIALEAELVYWLGDAPGSPISCWCYRRSSTVTCRRVAVPTRKKADWNTAATTSSKFWRQGLARRRRRSRRHCPGQGAHRTASESSTSYQIPLLDDGALKEMGYAAAGIGPIEANNLFNIYGGYALQPQPKDDPRPIGQLAQPREGIYPRH